MGVLAEGAGKGRLVDNIVHFARALRKAGLKVGPAQVSAAIKAVHAAGFSQKVDFYYTLRATLVTRATDLDVFHQIFQMFWRDPDYLERMIRMMSPFLEAAKGEEARPESAERRASDALGKGLDQDAKAPEREILELDARFNWSKNEVLRAKDFEQMSGAEQAEALTALRDLRMPLRALPTRRLRSSRFGTRPDVRAILKTMLRKGGETPKIARRAPQSRPPDIVALCDISGSMSVYSRMMMHFLHTLAATKGQDWGHVHGFSFGTRLTNISRALHLRDVDHALSALGRDAPDWQGGTRIGASLRDFNHDWSRRVLPRGAVVLLITDGLERDDIGLLSVEIARLARSCRQLIWLNPLLRWDGFEPKAAGIAAILPHVDRFLACHSLNSLEDLIVALSGPSLRRDFTCSNVEQTRIA